jgi:hypothetical protein
MGHAIAPDTGPVASGSLEICLLKIAKHQNMFIKLNHQDLYCCTMHFEDSLNIAHQQMH